MSAEANGTDPGDDELPDPEVERKWFVERLREAGVSAQRFIDVHDGAKGTTNHTQHEPDAEELSRSYDVYGGPGGDSDVVADPEEFEGDPAEVDVLWLVDVDVDDYENDGGEPTAGLESLPETFTIESPHTDGTTGGHRYYAVRGHVAAAFVDAYGKANPSPEWGEVRVYNQMCVGPGSQISPGGCVHEWCDTCKGCDKEWCDECAKPDGGFYRIAENREIAVLELETFVEAILRDLDGGDTDADTDADADADDEFDADLDLDLDLDFPYRDLYYIKLIDGEKNPIKSWGGYSQDYAEAENVYTHDQVLDSDHMRWGIVGIENDARSLLIYDLDLYKAPDFDADEITVDGTEGIPVVESGSGGLHAYTAVYEERTEGKESDFDVDADLPFDIDIRGSFVSHHVVAPTEIPGVDTEYTLQNDAPIWTYSDPRDSAASLKYTDSGESLIEYSADSGVGTIDFERADDPPEDMPTCYARGLELRAASPEDHPSTHKVNTLTALCGLASGYSAETMVEHFIEEYPPDDPNQEKTEYHLNQLVEKVDRGDLAPPAISTLREWGILDEDETCDCDIAYHGGGIERSPLANSERNKGVEKPEAFDFSVAMGGYGKLVEKTDEDGDPYYVWDEWTNFELELNSLIITPDGDVEMSITVHPRAEPAYTVEVEPIALNEPRSFKKEICTSATTTFDASRSDLAKIKQFVGAQDAPRKIGTNHMGYHRDYENDRSVWVTPNGNLGANGWVKETDLVLVEKGITAERKWRLSPEDGDDPDLDVVVEMLELIPETRDHERLLPLIGWFYAAATCPLVRDWEEQFNFASVTGETGSGKTTTISALWELMGMESEPLNPGTTEASLMTTFASAQSVPMWFDEYKPSDMSNHKVTTFSEKVRMAAKGQLDQRSNVDLSDETYSLRAPAIVSGEERIQGSAEERRGVFTSFRKATTKPGTSTAIANAKLTGTSTEDPNDPEKSLYFDGYDFKEHALAWIMWVCDQEPADLKTLWKDSDEYVRELLGGIGISGLGDLELQGLQTIRYGCELYCRFYTACGGDDPEAVISDAEINDAINFVISGAAGGENRKSHIDVLLEVASRAAADGYLEEDTQYTFVRKGKSNEELRLNLGNTFDKVKKYAKDHDVSDDLLNNKSDYDERLRNEGETINWFTCRKQQTPPVGSALGIDPDIAESEIDGFGRWMWDSEVEGSQGDEWQRLATNAEGRVNVTFEVTHRETDTPDSMAEKGVIADESKAMDYVVWASDRANIPAFEEGTCYAVKGAKIGRHDGAPQLVLDSGVREVIEVEPGYGHIESPDAGQNRTIDSAATAAADGGGSEINMVADRVLQVVEQHGPITSPMIKGALLPEGDDPDAVEDAIERLATNGVIYDPDGDGYESV